MYGCQQHLIKDSPEVMGFLEYICSEANKLTNCGIYYCRQMLFKAGKFLTRGELDKELKSNIHFKAMRSACAQQTLHSVIESFDSYKELLKLYKEEKLHFHPKPPNYRKKGGMAVVSYPSRWVKLVDNHLKFTLGNQVKAWFGIDHFLLHKPSNLEFETIKEYRILPRNGCFYIEFVYKQPEVKPIKANNNVLGIDPGLNNWITVVSNTGKSFIIDGKKNNQKFVQIPTAKLKERLAQLCQQYGINFIETEESYTSKASFLDDDFLPKYGEKPERWKASGKRIKRGLYCSSNGSLINADCNGSANIIRKVSAQLGFDLTKACRAVLTLPNRYFLDSLSQKYRKRYECGFNPLVTSA
ncbi:transposase [Spirulina sp. 06S082]|uniref:RNA-guided endonuclease InsQ/TnpB family protein n=1 Tax=Spirulina sp. 06S082 TaxID=3110248 RepID=UPI002B20EBE7|nr:transposase [Spirulina sp. 06S082]MEA5471668.1 transposase [Spirulina sp. 06S082]